MATSGTNPPKVCKVKLTLVSNPGETPRANCTPVSSPTMFVALTENPSNVQSGTVSWSGVSIPVQAVEGNNLLFSGTTSADNAPDTVSVKFDGFDSTNENCTTGTCALEGC